MKPRTTYFEVKSLLLSFAVVGLTLTTVTAQAGTELTEIEVFKRCYIRLTRSVPDQTHALYLQVMQGGKSAQTACMNLLDEAKLSAAGVLVNRGDAEARRILKTFNDLHRTWFQARTNFQYKPFTYVVKDGEESALFYTRAAFLPNEPFRSVVTMDSGLKGVRDRVVGGESGTFFAAQNFAGYGTTRSFSSSFDIYIGHLVYNPKTKVRTPASLVIPGDDGTQVGELVGVGPALSIKFPSFLGAKTVFSALPGEDDPVKAAAEINAAGIADAVDFEANRHFGGGILGSQNFLLNNAGLPAAQFNQGTPNVKFPGEGGETIVNRRIAARFFEDVLCHELPTLETADVENEVHPKSPNTFRQSVSCQQCHVQNDGAAKTFRNLFTFISEGADTSKGMQIVGMAALPTVPGASTFALQPPVGRLVYRQMLTHEKIDVAVTSLADIGRAVAAQDDLYRCAAKRYYKFFTGVDVSLSVVAKKPVDARHQDFVLNLASKLKTEQSVRSLISRIFASDAFRARNYKTEMP